MRVLMISTDKLVFNPESQVRARLAKLAEQTDQLQVIVFTKRQDHLEPIGDNKLFLHPTNSRSALMYVFDALKIGKKFKGLDLITCQDPFLTGLVGSSLVKKLGLKLELQLHTDVLTPAFRYLNFKNLVYYWLADRLLPRATQVRVVSEKLKQSLLAAGLVKSDQVYVLPIFIEPVAPIEPTWLSLIPRDCKIILMVGRLEAEKRFKLALAAFTLVTVKNTRLIIIGDGGEAVMIKNLAVKLGLEERIILAGRLTPAELSGSYRAAQVFFHTAAYEGYGLVLAEAAQAGLPIVSTDVGIAREVGALIVPPEPVKMAAALEQQLLSPQPASFQPISEQFYLTTILQHWSQLAVLGDN